MIRKIILILFPLLLSYLPITQAEEQERLLRYHSDLLVYPDGHLRVTETIRVWCQGERIRRGIYRDFPTRYRDLSGHRYNVPFTLLATSRDGRPEPHHLADLSNGVRIYLGDENTLLEPGEYEYTIEYETSRQIGFFDQHDELYWNVTGNGWEFAIEKVSATVALPPLAAANLISWNGFTGPQGSREHNLSMVKQDDGRFYFESSIVLNANEGLTIVLAWPKGIIREPKQVEKTALFLRDNLGIFVGFFGLLFLVLYYLWQWFRVGRDPQRGTIVPLFAPPEDLSPAAMRFLSRMSFDDTTFASFVLQAAVKGHLLIEEENGIYTLKRKTDGQTMTPSELAILNDLIAKGETLELRNTEHVRIHSAMDRLKKSLSSTFDTKYFNTNRQYFWPGLVFSIVVMGISIKSFSVAEAGFMLLWLSIWSIGVAAMVTNALSRWRHSIHAGGKVRLAGIGTAFFLSLFTLPFIGGEVFGLYMLGFVTNPWIILFFVAFVFVNYFFYYLLRAPTPLGRSLLDRIEGFKMYLAKAEEERLNLLNPPERTPELFERFLPYALALGVEQRWSEQFAEVLERSGLSPSSSQPIWYHSSSWDSGSWNGFASSFGGSFSSAISSSSTAPGSSSGSSGGSSGGGGGGGGGGGW